MFWGKISEKLYINQTIKHFTCIMDEKLHKTKTKVKPAFSNNSLRKTARMCKFMCIVYA